MLDLILILILILCFIRGYNAGLINGIKTLISGILSIVLAKLFCSPVAKIIIFETDIDENLTNWLTVHLNDLEKGQAALMGNTFTGFSSIIHNQMKSMLPELSLNSENFISSLTELLITCLSFVVLFFVLVFCFKIAANLLTVLLDFLAPTRLVNHFAGGLLYGIECLLVYAVLCLTFRPFLLAGKYFESGFLNSLQNAINHSVIVNIIETTLSFWGFM